jgi:hypothetical protein
VVGGAAALGARVASQEARSAAATMEDGSIPR